MRTFIPVILGLLIVTSAHSETAKSIYGIRPGSAPAMSLTEAVKKQQTLDEATIVVTGKVVKVCEAKGCWMQIEDGSTRVRTLFKDYGFFVPKNILNQQVKVEGTLQKKEISVSMQRHLLKDEGASAEEIAKVVEPKWNFQFVATGVEVQQP